jgi:hypothetical protein
MSWKSPTGHTTPTDWANSEWAYDEDVAKYAYCYTSPISWSSFLELLTPSAILCDRVRFYTVYSPNITIIDIDIYCNGNWCDVYNGAFTLGEWNEKIVPNGPLVVSKTRVRLYNNHTAATRQARFGEFDFNQLVARALVSDSLAGNSLIGKGLV